jgi:hypothetical protein
MFMNRRDFLWKLGVGLATSWTMNRLSWPIAAFAGPPEVRLALLADAHLKDGEEGRPEARLLARAVAEIRALKPAPDLVLFAGDLAHRGEARALALGREILADLPSPLLAVRGEGDGPGPAFCRLFGEERFSQAFPGGRLLGIPTRLSPRPGGAVFAIGPDHRGWLARELNRLAPETFLILLSHAPLAQIFKPWHQWTADAPEILALLSHFRRVLCLHGHAHRVGRAEGVMGGGGQGAVAPCPLPPTPSPNPLRLFLAGVVGASGPDYPGPGPRGWGGELEGRVGDLRSPSPPLNSTLHQSLPATGWPRPWPWEGTPFRVRAGQGPQGCGWGLLTVRAGAVSFTPRLWRG